MSHDHGMPTGLTRRAWLKGMGVIGAVALAQPALLKSQPAAPVPSSEPDPLHVLVGSDRLAAAFTAAGTHLPELRVTVTPTSTSLKQAIGTAANGTATLLLHTVPAALPGLWSTLRAVKRPWLIFNGGEDLPSTTPGLDDRPMVTLDQWRANWLLGSDAAHTQGGRLLVLANPYETAYDALDAFHRAFTLYGGGEVVFAFTPTGTPDLAAAIAQHQPTALFASYTGRAAAEFAAQYAAHGAGLPLYTTPFLLWDAPIPGAAAGAAYAPDMHTHAATWYDYLAQEALTAFVSGSIPDERPLYRLDGTGRAVGFLSGDTSAVPGLMRPGALKVGALHPYLPLV